MAQEILETFSGEFEEVSLRPDSTGGVFQIKLNGSLIWDRKEKGFPQIVDLKREIRDHIDPDRDLGHLDSTQ